ncbi:MAG: ATP-grasp domain-containing protein [Candidatus Bathyarchaeia archaeon]
MKILLYEHVCGGGYAGQSIPVSVLAEGFSMLRCAVADFRAANHEVTILLDARLAKFDPPTGANYTQQVLYADEPKKFLTNASKRNDAIYVIAPETGQTLQTYVKLSEETGTTSLNSQSAAIAEVADKANLYNRLQAKGFLTPKTMALNINSTIDEIRQSLKRELTYPLVFKPIDGAGCSGVSIINSDDDVLDGIAEVKSESKSPCFIAQEFVKGDAVSVSVLSNGDKAVALSLNKQLITFADAYQASSYEGGCTPLDHPKKKLAYSLAERVVKSFPGLRGYIGVDLVMGEKDLFVVDVNARLTTSYIGLRQVLNFNLAQALIDAVALRKLPEKISPTGVTCFSKIQTPCPSTGEYHRSLKLAGLISPPFPLNGSSVSTALVMGYGDNLKEAELHVEEAKKSLLNIII